MAECKSMINTSYIWSDVLSFRWREMRGSSDRGQIGCRCLARRGEDGCRERGDEKKIPRCARNDGKGKTKNQARVFPTRCVGTQTTRKPRHYEDFFPSLGRRAWRTAAGLKSGLYALSSELSGHRRKYQYRLTQIVLAYTISSPK